MAPEQPFSHSSVQVAVLEESTFLQTQEPPCFLTLQLDQYNLTALQLDGSSDGDGQPAHLTVSPHNKMSNNYIEVDRE